MSKAPTLQAGLSPEAVYAKSKVYAQRALRCKDTDDLDEYQLWASLALELLGKACLARIHPCLIANPTDHISLFASAGVNLGTDLKTIASHTLFERLRHIAKGFDDQVKTFCDDISKRRNAELHSGELPFKEMKLSAWEGRYWHAAQLILDRMDESLEEWLGATQAKAPKQIVQHARNAASEAALVRIDTTRERFAKKPKKEREAAIAYAEKMGTNGARNVIQLWADAIWKATCPSCGTSGFMAGAKFEEEIVETMSGNWDEPDEELVEKRYGAEEFFCPACELRLLGQVEIEAADMEDEYSEQEVRERRYEDEYNNE